MGQLEDLRSQCIVCDVNIVAGMPFGRGRGGLAKRTDKQAGADQEAEVHNDDGEEPTIEELRQLAPRDSVMATQDSRLGV